MCVFSIILKGNTFTVYKFCATSNYFIGPCLNPQSCDELISGCYNWKLRRISRVEVSTRFSLLTFFFLVELSLKGGRHCVWKLGKEQFPAGIKNRVR